MPGFEVFGEEERQAINDLFDKNGGILFAHGFDAMRNGIYRVREFEQATAKRMGARFAQAVCSGSAALRVGLEALGVGSGDEVITQSFTFVATVEAILSVGATPVVVDVDDSLTMCPRALEAAVTDKTKVIIPVHMMGAPADMDAIMAIAATRGVKVLEDAAQAVGGTYKGRALGTIADLGAYSFDAGKVILTGEGGMVLTNDENLYVRARAIQDHGHEYSTTTPRGLERALTVGFNYRMTELQGAMGLVQLGKLDMILQRQRENKTKLKAAISGMPVQWRRMNDAEGEIHDAIIFFTKTPGQAQAFAKAMGNAGLGTKNLPDAIRWHFARDWQQMWNACGAYADSFPREWEQSANLLSRSIAVPVMVKMSDERIGEVAEKLNRIAEDVL